MSNKKLYIKYFVLSPREISPEGEASRAAILKYADVIKEDNPMLAHELRHWIEEIVADIEFSED